MQRVAVISLILVFLVVSAAMAVIYPMGMKDNGGAVVLVTSAEKTLSAGSVAPETNVSGAIQPVPSSESAFAQKIAADELVITAGATGGVGALEAVARTGPYFGLVGVSTVSMPVAIAIHMDELSVTTRSFERGCRMRLAKLSGISSVLTPKHDLVAFNSGSEVPMIGKLITSSAMQGTYSVARGAPVPEASRARSA